MKQLKVLLPTNLSSSACRAADFIVSLIGRNGEFKLLNSFPLVYRSGFYDSFQNYAPDYDEIPQEKLKRERNRLIQKFGNQNIEIKAMYGDPLSDLIKIAEEGADLVVMGEEQYSSWSNQKVQRLKTSMVHLEIPLIFIPTIHTFEKIETIFLIVDVNDRHKEELIALISNLSEVSGTKFQIISIDERGSKLNGASTKESIGTRTVATPNDLKALLTNTNAGNTMVVSTIQNHDVKFSETIHDAFQDSAIIQTKLLMPRKSSENLLRGA